LTQAVAYDDAKAGAVIAVQSFGDFQILIFSIDTLFQSI
jgi:hypothetical protein